MNRSDGVRLWPVVLAEFERRVLSLGEGSQVALLVRVHRGRRWVFVWDRVVPDNEPFVEQQWEVVV